MMQSIAELYAHTSWRLVPICLALQACSHLPGPLGHCSHLDSLVPHSIKCMPASVLMAGCCLLAVQAFRTVFEVASWRAACDASAAGMKSSLKLYREVLDHLSEGLRFYSSLQVRAGIFRGAVGCHGLSSDATCRMGHDQPPGRVCKLL